MREVNQKTRKKTGEARDERLLWGPAALSAKRDDIRELQARIAPIRDSWVRRNRYFYERMKHLFRFIVEPNKRVLSIRCGTAPFLETVAPSRGVGVELTEEMVAAARARCPQYEFVQQDPEELELDEKFDYILFNRVSDTVDVLSALRRLNGCCTPDTRIVIYDYNHLWRPIIKAAEAIGLKTPMTEQNWLSEHDLVGLLRLAGFEHLHTCREILFPIGIPVFSEFMNRILAQLPLVNRLCMIHVLVARRVPEPRPPESVSVSVVVPCKNERDNIEAAVKRIPKLGNATEIIFCDDRSTDGTAQKVLEMQMRFPDRNIRLVEGPGICKAENVRVGFDAAQGDVLMILDADLTVMPEELPYFLDALVEGKGEFINGTRMVYPMQKQAMKSFNMAGNKVFSAIFSYLLGQKLTDTLCGTKVLRKSAWERMKRFRRTWGMQDRWGDYELLFGAARLHLRIAELPVHYQERVYGTTKMVKVFRNGMIMLKMCLEAFFKLKARFLRA